MPGETVVFWDRVGLRELPYHRNHETPEYKKAKGQAIDRRVTTDDKSWHWLELLDTVWHVYSLVQKSIKHKKQLPTDAWSGFLESAGLNTQTMPQIASSPSQVTRFLWQSFLLHTAAGSADQPAAVMRQVFDEVVEEKLPSVCRLKGSYLFVGYVASLLMHFRYSEVGDLKRLFGLLKEEQQLLVAHRCELVQLEKDKRFQQLVTKRSHPPETPIRLELQEHMSEFIVFLFQPSRYPVRDARGEPTRYDGWHKKATHDTEAFADVLGLLSGSEPHGCHYMQAWEAEESNQLGRVAAQCTKPVACLEEKGDALLEVGMHHDGSVFSPFSVKVKARKDSSQLSRQCFFEQRLASQRAAISWLIAGTVIGFLIGVLPGVLCLIQLCHELAVLKRREASLQEPCRAGSGFNEHRSFVLAICGPSEGKAQRDYLAFSKGARN